MHRTVQIIILLFIFFPMGFLIYQKSCQDETSSRVDIKTKPETKFDDNNSELLGQPENSASTIFTQSDAEEKGKIPRSGRHYLAPVSQDRAGAITATSDRSSSLTMLVSVSGQIRYFSGQTNSLGQVMPVNPNRYLAGERLVIHLDFNKVPGLIEIRMNNQSWYFCGFPGWLSYETSLMIPDWPSTLSWDGERLSPPLSLLIRAAAADDPGQVAGQTIEGIELTGHVHQIVRSQPAHP